MRSDKRGTKVGSKGVKAGVKAAKPQVAAKPSNSMFYEVDAVPGLEAVAYQELEQRFGKLIRFRHRIDEVAAFGSIQFFYTGAVADLLQLQTALTAYVVCVFDVPRPQALLGHEHLQRIVERCKIACQLSPDSTFATLYLAAAGADSPVMMRLKEELATQLGLRVSATDGDLVLRVRRPQSGKPGWEVLIRLSARPLSVRRWRVCDRQGGLNAAVAHAVVLLTQPRPGDHFLNVCCGSGTLMIERRAHGPAARVLGCDVEAAAVECARANVVASGFAEQIELFGWDAQSMPLPDQSVDVICADLPFGKSVGSHQANTDLYPRLLQEMARVAKPGARVCLLTQELRLMDALLETPTWGNIHTFNVVIGGLRPRIYLLTRMGR